ncbi:IMPACT family protein [Arsenicibacter rosenii]|uniref:YigZ family protein n=1 Tax=Arsenicibacter rosenii TaxID=1750698 RepID=A0A1S2VPA8_9BACT|nr:YigZ family protein [Arsenicibacter rosenii]OIN60230.1 YigZ family protein [Arsenicibacter rosenii]
MLFDDTYRTIAKPAEGLFRDKGSKFLAYAYPVTTENEAKAYLDALRKEHPKANHHCYAYRLGPDKNTYRASDDGEPAGTAGRPILNTLYSHDLTNILVVVVRYFGGTLLGVPGLINAYKSSTVEVLSGAVVVEKTVNERYRIVFGFERMNDVMKIVKDMQLTVLGQTYDNECVLRIELRKSLVNQVLGRFEKLDEVTTEWETA